MIKKLVVVIIVVGAGLFVTVPDVFAMCPCTEAYTQDEFWFLDDDAGANAASGWNGGATAQDTNITGVAKETNFRLRIEVQETNGNDQDAAFLSQIEYAESASSCTDGGVTWVPVSGVSAKVIYSTSSNFTSPVASTERLVLNEPSAPVFFAGEVVDDRNPTADKGTLSDEDSEDEWSLQFTSSAVDDTIYTFRLTDNGGTTNWTYTGCPTARTAVAVTAAFTQEDHEWFVNADSMSLTDQWPSGARDIAETTAIGLPVANELITDGDQIRLQMNFSVSTASMSASLKSFKLQYAEADDCTGVSSWSVVAAVSATTDAWRMYDGWSGGTESTQANQISTSSPNTDGLFSEVNPTVGTNPLGVPIGDYSEWDWPIEFHAAQGNTGSSYCFRMVESDDTAFTAYNNYPRVVTAPTVGNLMRHGNFFSSQAEQGFFWAN